MKGACFNLNEANLHIDAAKYQKDEAPAVFVSETLDKKTRLNTCLTLIVRICSTKTILVQLLEYPHTLFFYFFGRITFKSRTTSSKSTEKCCWTRCLKPGTQQNKEAAGKKNTPELSAAGDFPAWQSFSFCCSFSVNRQKRSEKRK